MNSSMYLNCFTVIMLNILWYTIINGTTHHHLLLCVKWLHFNC